MRSVNLVLREQIFGFPSQDLRTQRWLDKPKQLLNFRTNKFVDDPFEPEDWLKLDPAARARRCRLMATRARETALAATRPEEKEHYNLIAAAWEHLAELIERKNPQ